MGRYIITGGLLLAWLAAAQTSTLNVSHDLTTLKITTQNMTPNVAALDSQPLFTAAAAYARTNGISTITADPGSYYFLTSPSGRDAYLNLANLSNLTIDLAGSDLYFQSGSWTGIWCTNCQNVRFLNFTMDALQLPYTQIKVTSADAASGRISYSPFGNWEPATNFNVIRNPSGTALEPLYAFVFRNGTPLRTTSRMSVQRPIGATSLTVASDGSPWSNPAQLASVQAGDVIVLSARAGTPTLNISGGGNNTVRNVSVYYGGGVGVMLQACPGAVVDQVLVIPRPGTDRLMSSNADGIGAIQLGQNLTIRRSRVRRTGDDGMSPNSQQLAIVTGQPATRTVQVNRSGYSDFANGTAVQFIDNATGFTAVTAKIVSQDPPYSTATPAFGSAVTLVFDQDIPVLAKSDAMVYADAAFRGAGLLMENNLVQDVVFARGMSLWGLQGGTISGNMIRNVPMSAINVLEKTSTENWMTGPVANVTLRANAIEQYSGAYGTALNHGLAGIDIYATDLNSAFVAGSPFQNLTISNNFIGAGAYSGMLVGNTNGAVLADNTLMNVATNPAANNPSAAFARLVSQPVAINNSVGISQTGNTVDNVAAQAFITSAISYSNEAVAPDSWAAVFGSKLAARTDVASTSPFPTTLDQVTVAIKDSLGVVRLAPIWFVSPGQINFLVPSDCAAGAAVVTVSSGGVVAGRGAILIDTLAPALFSADGSGGGPGLGQAVVTKPDGTQKYSELSQPIDTGSGGDVATLVLYATGVRGFTSLSGVVAYIGGVRAPAQYAGVVGTYFGLDQINVNVPAQLRGAGAVTLQLSVNGLMSNSLQLVIH